MIYDGAPAAIGLHYKTGYRGRRVVRDLSERHEFVQPLAGPRCKARGPPGQCRVAVRLSLLVVYLKPPNSPLRALAGPLLVGNEAPWAIAGRLLRPQIPFLVRQTLLKRFAFEQPLRILFDRCSLVRQFHAVVFEPP